MTAPTAAPASDVRAETEREIERWKRAAHDFACAMPSEFATEEQLERWEREALAEADRLAATLEPTHEH